MQPVQAGHARGRRRDAAVHALRRQRRARSRPSGGTSRRTSASRGGRTCESGWLRARARRSGAGDGPRRLLGELQPRAHGSVHGRSTAATPAAPRRRTATSPTATSCTPGESWPILLRDDSRLGPPATCPDGAVTRRVRAADAGVSDPRDGREQPEHLRSGHHAAVHAVVDGRLPALADQRLGDRGALPRQPQRRTRGPPRTGTSGTSSRTASSTSSGSRRRICGRTSRPAAATRSATSAPGTARRRCRSTWRTSPAQSAATDPSRYTAAFANTTWTQHLGYIDPAPDTAANNLHSDATRRANAITAGLAPNFFVMNPAVGEREHPARVGRQPLPLAADRVSPPAVARAARQRQLHVRAGSCDSSLETIHEPRFYRRGRRRAARVRS